MMAYERKPLHLVISTIGLAFLLLSPGCGRKRLTPAKGNPTGSGVKALVRQLEDEAKGAERSTCGPPSAKELRNIARAIEQYGSDGVKNGCDVFCAFVSRANGSPELLVRAITASSFQYGGIEVCDRRGQVIQRIKPFASIVKCIGAPSVADRHFISVLSVVNPDLPRSGCTFMRDDAGSGRDIYLVVAATIAKMRHRGTFWDI